MATPEARFVREPKKTVAYIELKGPYSGAGRAMAELWRWVESAGAETAGDPFCMFFDNPSETPEAELRSAVCVPIRGDVAPDGRFQVRELPEADAAETRHVGPPEEFGRTYGPFLESLMAAGFSIAEPAREYFRRPEDAGGPGTGYAIRQPISKK